MQTKQKREPMTEVQWRRLCEGFHAAVLTVIILSIISFILMGIIGWLHKEQSMQNVRHEVQTEMLQAGCKCPIQALQQEDTQGTQQ